jgi:pathogenesis-related protein 1
MKLAVAALLALAMAAATVAAQSSPQDFLDPHNAARTAVGVGPVSWDDNVAAYAQSYADQRRGDCALQHSSNSPYGENIAAGPAGAALSASDAVRLWVDEKQYYHHDTNSCSAPAGQSCLHYTQVVWRDTKAIGCARVGCNNGGTFVICSYNPPGNYVGQSPY